MSIVIRKAEPSDAPELFRLNENFNGKSVITVKQIELSLRENNQEQVFVADRDGALAGFCCVQIFKSFCYSVNYAEITELYVDKQYQHKGIGTMLIEFAERYFEEMNIKNFQLFTGSKNYSAQAFYEKNGYEKSTEIMYRKRR